MPALCLCLHFCGPATHQCASVTPETPGTLAITTPLKAKPWGRGRARVGVHPVMQVPRPGPLCQVWWVETRCIFLVLFLSGCPKSGPSERLSWSIPWQTPPAVTTTWAHTPRGPPDLPPPGTSPRESPATLAASPLCPTVQMDPWRPDPVGAKTAYSGGWCLC